MAPVTRADLLRLADPLPPDHIEWRVQQAGEKNGKPWARVLAYVTNRAIMQRLDDVLGPENWRNEFRASAGAKDGGVLCGLWIRVHSESCTDGEWVVKWDGADETDIEPTKGGVSSAMKRAAVQWGLGRYLYELEEGWAVVHDGGRFSAKTKDGKWFKWDPPALPTWALPGGSGTPHRDPTPSARPTTTPTATGRGSTAPAPNASPSVPAPAVPADTPVDGARAASQSSSAAGGTSSHADGAKCPKCGGPCWDNRRERDGSPKKNPKAPDFKCKDKSCDGVIWPAREGRTAQGRNVAKLAFPEKMPPQLRELAGKLYVEVPSRRLTEAMDFVRMKGTTDAHRQMVDDIAYVLEERRLKGDAGPAEGPPPSPGSHNRRGNLPDDPAEAAA
jgi:hypothetical protein